MFTPSPNLTHRLWGKADPAVPGGWHPALLHMLDVAAVSLELLSDGLATALGEDLRKPAPGVSLRDSELAFIIACHDLGKLTPGFQAKVPSLKEPLEQAGLDFPELSEPNHARGTSELGPELLEARNVEPGVASLWSMAVGAHHGRVFPGDRSRAKSRKRYGSDPWPALRAQAVEQLAHALGSDPTRAVGVPCDPWLMALSGLTVVADWIGSDTNYFPYCPGRSASPDYVAEARARAARALSDLGWRGWHPSATEVEWSDLFPSFEPNAVQQQVIEATDRLTSPGLLLIEAPPGCGNTAAAYYAAEAQIARFGLGGTYLALPTQATSNQMFERVRDFLRRRYPEAQVNLHLLHALKDLQPAYKAIQTRSIDGQDEDAAVVADAWFRGKRRGLLSPFAVGTVDQAMLAAIQSKFFHLRMLGLCRKVLVIDEVHAYDTFMSRILDRLLSWLAELGSPVVLLSATLPASRRRELLEAYGGVVATASAPYPRVLVAAPKEAAKALPIDREGMTREVRLEWHPARTENLARELGDVLRTGGCAAWICNTVGRAQEAYRALIDSGWPVEESILFHARFPIEARLDREQRVLGALARSSARPHRLVVVATQVVEQSLDLDFDLLLTELAPIDLLVQRAGRLHRHPERDPGRPEVLSAPTIWVAVDDTDGLPDFGPSEHVYHRHILLRTWCALRNRTAWRVPEDADALLDLVYGPAGPQADLAPALVAAWEESAGDLEEILARAAMSGSAQLVPRPAAPGDGESFLDHITRELADPEDDPTRHRDLLARTRDIEASVTVVCLHRDSAGRVVLSPSDDTRVDLETGPPGTWLVSMLIARSMSVQHRSWAARLRRQGPPTAWRRVGALRNARALVFDNWGEAQVDGHRLTLDPELGLLLDPQEGWA